MSKKSFKDYDPLAYFVGGGREEKKTPAATEAAAADYKLEPTTEEEPHEVTAAPLEGVKYVPVETKTKHLHLLMRASIVAAAKRAANASGVSVNELFAVAMENYLKGKGEL